MNMPSDPFKPTSCAKCGLPVQTTGFNVVFTKNGPVFGRNAEPKWEHAVEDEDTDVDINADKDHEGIPSDGRSHEDDAQRLEHDNSMEQFSDNLNLSKQFMGVVDPKTQIECNSCGRVVLRDSSSNGKCSRCADSSRGSRSSTGYTCGVCGKWSSTSDENMNHRCFE